MFYVFNGDNWTHHDTVADAIIEAKAAIDYARGCCDPEWPDWVEHISVYKSPADCDEPDEDGQHLHQAQECNVQDIPKGSGCGYYCDYHLFAVGSEPLT